jgi:Sulfotransferase domain
MSLRIVGAGLGRTGTHSLKLALERLLDAPCYHMVEVFAHPEHIAVWRAAVDGDPVDWNGLMDGYAASVDWPAAAFWRELSDANPDAMVLLSTRSSPGAWWKSANETIFQVGRSTSDDPALAEFNGFPQALFEKTFTPGWTDEHEAMRAYEAHNAAVRAEVPAHRLVDWQPGDGWEPICAALDVAVPAEPFPHVNTTDEFRKMTGLED